MKLDLFQSFLESMRGCRRAFHVLRAFEEENERDAAQREQAEQIKIIHERPQMRLLIQQRVNRAVGLLRRGHRIGVVSEQFLAATSRCVNAGSVAVKCPTISA